MSTIPRNFKDSVTPARISINGTDGVIAYCNGDYAWTAAEEERFTAAGKQVLHYDVIGNAWLKASILDVERYDATPDTAREWIQERNAYRHDATIYISKDNVSELFAKCGGLTYWLLLADWTGVPHMPRIPVPGGVRIAGSQYATIKGEFDASSVYADDWHPRPAK